MLRTHPLRDPLEPAHAAPNERSVNAAPQARLPSQVNEQLVTPDVEPALDIESIIARGHAKVMAHYYQLLRSQSLPATERADIEARMAREEKYWREQFAMRREANQLLAEHSLLIYTGESGCS